MRLTGRGIAVLVLAVSLLAFGQWAGYPLLRALGAVMLVVVAVAVGITARGLRVTVRRSVYPDRVERGRPALATLHVHNPTTGRQAAFHATDHAGDATEVIRVRSLAAGGEAPYNYKLPTSKRGKLVVGPLTLYRTDAFGLATNRVPTGDTATVLVHPRRFPARSLVGGHPRHYHSGSTVDDTLRGSMELQDVREYASGDEIRHVHWKATARMNRLMVRDLTDPEQPRFTVLLDTRPGALTPAAFEEAVDVAASLLSASARAGHHSRLITSTGLDVVTRGGGQGVIGLLDALSEVRQTGDRDAAVVPKKLLANQEASGRLVVVTSTDAEMSSLAWLRRSFPVIFLIALDTDGRRHDHVAGARVLSASNAEQAVRQWNEIVK